MTICGVVILALGVPDRLRVYNKGDKDGICTTENGGHQGICQDKNVL